jgi:hypothetical protein
VDLGLFATNKVMVRVFQPFLAMPEVANKELVVSLLSVVDVSLEIKEDDGCGVFMVARQLMVVFGKERK